MEGGHDGGCLKIEDCRKSKMLDLSRNSEKFFYLTFLNVDCEHEMDPIYNGYRVELIYNLLWEAPIFPVLPSVSTFQKALVRFIIQAMYK